MLAYLSWRVGQGYHEVIELNFMIAGHTKFGPDRFFGLFKRKFRVSYVSCLEDMKQVCNVIHAIVLIQSFNIITSMCYSFSVCGAFI